MKNKYIKYIICFFSILSIVVSPALSISACELCNEEIRALDSSFGASVVHGVSFVMVDVDSGDVFPCHFSGVREIDNDRGAQLILTPETPIKVGQRFQILVTLKIENDAYLSDTNFVKGSYRVGFATERFRILQDSTGESSDYLAYTYRSNCLDNPKYSQFGTIKYVNTQYGYYADSIYTINKAGEVYDYYRTNLYIQATTNFYSFSLLLYYWDFDIMSQSEYAAEKIIQNQNENTDKLINAGEDIKQPDFNNTNNSLDDTTKQMNKIDGAYKIDSTSTNKSLSQGKDFMLGTDMQRASIQVKNWIEKFASDNISISGFLISCMVLGVCFWVIGRKARK